MFSYSGKNTSIELHNINNLFNVFSDVLIKNFIKLQDLFQNEVKNVAFFTIVKIKIIYDITHNFIEFKINFKIYLQFNKEYHLLDFFLKNL